MKLTVIDATHLQEIARKQVLNLAKEQNCHSVAIVFNIPEAILKQRNAARPERQLPEHVIRRHANDLRRCIRGLKKEGFRFVYVLNGVDEVDAAEIPRWCKGINRLHLQGIYQERYQACNGRCSIGCSDSAHDPELL